MKDDQGRANKAATSLWHGTCRIEGAADEVWTMLSTEQQQVVWCCHAPITVKWN